MATFPDPADVRLGVQYGALDTDQTGTLVGCVDAGGTNNSYPGGLDFAASFQPAPFVMSSIGSTIGPPGAIDASGMVYGVYGSGIILDNLGAFQGTYGVLDGTGTFGGSTGVLDASQVYHTYGILDASLTFQGTTGILDSNAIFQGVSGMLDNLSAFHLFGILSNSEVFYSAGILTGGLFRGDVGIVDGTGTFKSVTGTLNSSLVFNAMGVIGPGGNYFSQDYALTTAGGTVVLPSVGNVKHGVTYGANSSLTGTLVGGTPSGRVIGG
jgi:hypothetical protein